MVGARNRGARNTVFCILSFFLMANEYDLYFLGASLFPTLEIPMFNFEIYVNRLATTPR